MRRLSTYLFASVLVAVVALSATIASGHAPVLGLDLQGGVSIVYAPVGHVRASSLDVALDVMRQRVDSLGVAEPEISRQGSNIVVDLPGVKNRARAERVVGQTAELRFREVIATLPPLAASASSPTTTTAPGAATPTTSVEPPSTTTTLAASDTAARAAVASCDQNAIAALAEIPTTSRADDRKDACVVLPQAADGRPNRLSGRLLLGPVNPAKANSAGGTFTGGFTGSLVKHASSSFASGQGWAVTMSLTGDGQNRMNVLAAKLFNQPAPQNEFAIVLDGVVRSAPRFDTGSFPGDVQITGSFTQAAAEELAKVIDGGALPVVLEKLTTQNVSPTLGQDQLDAGVAAGAIGLALVALYVIAFYRVLGVVVIVGLALSGSLLYSLITFMGQQWGLTLTLAGVTGLIVSVGVTVDSYIVYFERLKDEVRTGRTVRSSVGRGFVRSFRTIVAADLVSLIGALALYVLAVGSVRGFALYLGISTLLDLAVSYFFMHPVVSFLARRPALVRMRGVGIAAGLDVAEVRA